MKRTGKILNHFCQIMDAFFEIEWKGSPVGVHTFEINNQRVFRVMIKSPIVILRANHEEGYKFWTSIPEGRQSEAKAIGPLIEQYYRSKK
jgi:hypothetical protein